VSNALLAMVKAKRPAFLKTHTVPTYTADALRDQTTIIHDETTYLQLASIGGPKLDAPEGEFDDLAVAYGLGCTAIQIGGVTAEIGGDPTQGHRG